MVDLRLLDLSLGLLHLKRVDWWGIVLRLRSLNRKSKLLILQLLDLALRLLQLNRIVGWDILLRLLNLQLRSRLLHLKLIDRRKEMPRLLSLRLKWRSKWI